MRQTPDINGLKEVFAGALVVDGDLMDYVADVVNNRVPDKIWDFDAEEYVPFNWEKPILEYGIQANEEDTRRGYGEKGVNVQFRIMCHDRGDRPGLVNYDRCHEALWLVDAALDSMPRAYTSHSVEWKIWYLWKVRETPEMIQDDSGEYVHVGVGAIYECRVR